MNMSGTNSGQRTPGKFEEPDDVPMSFDANDDGLAIETTPERKKMGLTTILLLAVVVVGAVSLYFMRAIGGSGDASATASNKVVEDFLKARTAAAAPQEAPKNLLDTDGYAALQIKRDELRKNPFVIASAPPPVAPVAQSPSSSPQQPAQAPVVRDERPTRIGAWEAEVEKNAAGIKVQSTITGARPDQGMANVNGKVLRPGDMLTLPKSALVYIVREIASDGVVFEVVNEEYRHARRVTVNVNRNF